MKIIQFLPYFPPHKGGLETHAEEWGNYWIKKGFGEVFNVITSFNQDYSLGEKIIFKSEVIGYKKNGVENLIIPSFEIITNFPVYKFWTKKYKLIIKYLKTKNINLVITRTRFFSTSLNGGFFARSQGIKWIHIEHGGDFVKLNSAGKTLVSKIYDKTIGEWIFKKADLLIGVSIACGNFIQKNFINREVKVIYRGVNLEKINLKKIGELKIIFIGRLVKLKGVDLLIKAFGKIQKNNPKIKLEIIGDGEEKKDLEKLSKKLNLKNINFLGFKDKIFISNHLSKNNFILVNPSYQEGLPTSVIEGLFYGNVVVATNAGGTKEISEKEDLILTKIGNLKDLENSLNFGINNFKNLKGKSQKLIEEKFNWDQNIEKYFKYFNEK